MAESTRITPLEPDFPFQIISHLVPVAPFREYPHAIIDETKGVRLAVKQYIPRDVRPADREDAITIIAAGGLGFIKELYEPLFEEIFRRCSRSGMKIRSIWIADMFNVGESAVANTDNLGCDPAWIDHAHDLWSVINFFKSEMAKPIIGLGHSYGCNQLLCLSSWHPSLFHSFAFIEPGIDEQYGRGITIPWSLSVLRQRDRWLTKAEAEEGAVKGQHAETWDERVQARLKRYSVVKRTAAAGETWNLTTPKDQIASLVSRFNPEMLGLGPGGIEEMTLEQRQRIPDIDPSANNLGPFYRKELRMAWRLLPGVRPWVLYINGSNSPFFGHPETREERARLTGIGVGGNGGMKLGAVKQIVIEKGRHTMPFDRNMNQVAEQVSDWLKTESGRWIEGAERHREDWIKRSTEEKQTVGSEFIAALAAEMKKMKRPGKM
ncbi:hypothetical protein N7532_003518 [Penicillium argentinense]|uniref:AB hydrolase-1 domain-containing protein n=1 Tax=Penicillium argentinense TaxID=1131581 RepID=A0A9W9KE31_9EURO|nr:uncharacterized protein N7532_003518 [Penicillium argentinense]KAJ5102989.1 hypothetical protein N7532_003518 [Penicillium argentinense]